MQVGRPLLEICVDGPDGMAAAIAGGADRIELCAALELGGLTPSSALVAAAVASGTRTHVMVRPRGGDFRYTAAEMALMVEEVGRLRDMGVAGVVVGSLTDRDALDTAALARLRDAAAGIAITLHRAIDLTTDPVEAVTVAGELGYDYVLSSGGARSAMEGRATLARMVDAASANLSVIAGAGVTAENAASLIRETGVTQVHSSASKSAGPVEGRLDALGFAIGRSRATDAAMVAALKRAVADA